MVLIFLLFLSVLGRPTNRNKAATPKVRPIKVDGNLVEPENPDPPAEEPDKEDSDIGDDWEKNMKGFVPADIVTFEISGRGVEEFFEMIDYIPSKVRGAWFTSNYESRDIEFIVYDPSNNPILQKRGKSESIFFFEANRKGIYSFVFHNTKVLQQHTLTFALHCGNSTQEILKTEHLDPVEKELLNISGNIKDFQVDQQFALMRQETYLGTIAGANMYLFWLCLIECLGAAALSAWQIYYIKRLLDNRRII